MYWGEASVPGHGLLLLTCVSTERVFSPDGLDAVEMDRGHTVPALSHRQAA